MKAKGLLATIALISSISLALERGFEWGGDWMERKDYQHFEIPDSKIAEWYPEYVG